MEYRYGLASPADVANMNGRAILQAIVDGHLPQPPISQVLDFWLVEVGDGFAAFEGEPSSRLLNPMGTVHGGWPLTLIDSATGCAASSLLPAGVGYTTVETKGNFSRPIKPDTGRVRVEGRVITQGRQIITAEARVLAKDGRVLGHGTSTLLVLSAARE
ncbi:aromatic compound catabolic protein [Cupriavidus sp. TA19]|uniref:PaaI family thioesterase n=1 Tax=unclassified Cupriavidus TaxID=2640874 RepID=UPI000E2EF6DF|nr:MULTISPECIES: PaaI family thioesterase [unclassified Cupriavidus]BDB28356.1 PaaI family thioesterase [Cupriavidus sp. P-10]GLC91129.1 aromatic compound catabolic protein [Cupriavidus sp. TA19]